MEISIGKNSKATRQPTREKTRKRDSNEETQAQKKKDKNKDKKNDKSKQEKNEGKKEGKKEKKVKKTEGSTTHTVAIPVQEDNEAILAPEMTAKTRKRLKDARKFVTKDRTGMGRTDDASDLLDDQYDDEIVEYTRSLEEKMKPNPSYMEHQDDIDWSMRAKLVEWLVQFRMVFDLKPEVLSTAVNYLDRFLSVKTVYREKLQLVGCTALFIASKYESVSQIKKKTMVAMSQDAFTVEELLRAEWYMLNALNFELGWPAPTGFLERLKKADRKSKRAQHMSRCFLDIIMIDRRFVSCVPSYLAAGADCLARFMLKQKNWVFASTHIYSRTY
jgi:G2/mitotic-specific cyclin 3/4